MSSGTADCSISTELLIWTEAKTLLLSFLLQFAEQNYQWLLYAHDIFSIYYKHFGNDNVFSHPFSNNRITAEGSVLLGKGLAVIDSLRVLLVSNRGLNKVFLVPGWFYCLPMNVPLMYYTTLWRKGDGSGVKWGSLRSMVFYVSVFLCHPLA